MIVERKLPAVPLNFGDEAVRDVTIGQLLAEAATVSPDAIALVDGVPAKTQRRRWTYRQLHDIAGQVARALLTRLQPGDRIVLVSPNCPEWIMLQHGVALAGMVLVPANPAYRSDELRHIIEQSEAAAVFYAAEWRGNDIAGLVREICAGRTDGAEAVCLSDWAEFLQWGNRAMALPQVSPGNPAIIQFTSGTTGQPKGAVLVHRGIVNPPRYVAQRIGFPPHGVWINAMPMYHIGGSVLTSLATLNAHGAFVLMREWDPALTLELVEEERGQAMLVVPTMILALLDTLQAAPRDLSSLELILTGATAVPPALTERARRELGCDVLITFGQTEASGTVSTTGRGDSVRHLAETIGRPLPNVEIAIRDPHTGAPMAGGEVGEIWMRGYQVMQGYYRQEQETGSAITADGWLRSGDLGYFDADGYLSICGRMKDVIIRGGMNIYPREIEEVLLAHPAVAEVAVIAVPDARWGEVVAAVIRPAKPGQPLALDDLATLCRQKLAAHKCPVQWGTVDGFPLTPSGKIQKFAVQDLVLNGSIPVSAVAAVNATGR